MHRPAPLRCDASFPALILCGSLSPGGGLWSHAFSRCSGARTVRFRARSDLADAGGLIAGEGTIYPLLARLRLNGLVQTTWEESAQGPPRRYYRLTEAGDIALHGVRRPLEAVPRRGRPHPRGSISGMKLRNGADRLVNRSHATRMWCSSTRTGRRLLRREGSGSVGEPAVSAGPEDPMAARVRRPGESGNGRGPRSSFFRRSPGPSGWAHAVQSAARFTARCGPQRPGPSGGNRTPKGGNGPRRRSLGRRWAVCRPSRSTS